MEACIPNIGPRQRRRRLLNGALSLVIAVALGTWLAATGASPVAGALVFPPLLMAAIGFFQHREKT